MTTAAKTERAPEESVQPNASGDPQKLRAACDGLKRLAERFPKEVAKILDVEDDDQVGDVCCTIYEMVNQAMAKNGFACIADVAELCERWKPKEGAESPTEREQPSGQKSDASTSLHDCWYAIRHAHSELDNTLRLLDGIGATVYERGCGSGENLVLSECDATAILYLKRTIQHRLSELSDVLAKQDSVLNELSSAERKAGGTPATSRSDPAQPANTGDAKPAATADLDDIRERVRRIAGLVQASVLCGASLYYEDDGHGDPADYATAVYQATQAASNELAKLQESLSGTQVGGGA